MNITIIIPVEDDELQHVPECIDSCLDSINSIAEDNTYEIIVMDNCSKSFFEISFNSKSVKYERLEQKVKFLELFEEAISKALGTHFIFLSPKSRFMPQYLRYAIETMQEKGKNYFFHSFLNIERFVIPFLKGKNRL